MTAADWNAHMRGATDARSGMAPRETGASYMQGWSAANAQAQAKGLNR